MGIIDFIKSIFSFKTQIKEAPIPEENQEEWTKLQDEYYSLDEERKSIRMELEGLDVKADRGDIEPNAKEALYKVKLIRAGRIIKRVVKINSLASNRIGARLVGLQLGAFAPAIKEAYEEAVSKLFTKFEEKLFESINDSVKMKISRLTQSVTKVESKTEEAVQERIEDIQVQTKTQISDIVSKAENEVEGLKDKYDEATRSLEKEIAELKEKSEQRISEIEQSASDEGEKGKKILEAKDDEIVSLQLKIDDLIQSVTKQKEEIEQINRSIKTEDGQPVNITSILTEFDDTKALNDSLSERNAHLQEEVNRLYNLTEREPTFRIYWL
ncbi:MAG: hypothetical protein ACXACA_02155, partial [Candidatus Ranarchaeia archaeon]